MKHPKACDYDDTKELDALSVAMPHAELYINIMVRGLYITRGTKIKLSATSVVLPKK